MIDPLDPGFAAADTLPTGAPAVLAPEPRPELVTLPDADPYDAVPPGAEVPRMRTPLTAIELRSALILGHRETTGGDIPPARLRASWCMAAVEHAGYLARVTPVVVGGAVWCNNIGNIGVGKWAGDWFALAAEELLASGRRVVTQRLRAHSGPVDGAADYWAFLLGGYPEAIEAMDRGDLPGVARALKERRYYTALESEYARGLVTWAREDDRRWGD